MGVGIVRVLVVDDSAVARVALTNILSSDPELMVVGTARDANVAAEKLRSKGADVLTLDLCMPGVDGLSFLRRLMKQRPMPVVVCAGQVARDDIEGLAALEAGAFDVVPKPGENDPAGVAALIKAVKGAARQRKLRRPPIDKLEVEPKHTADVIFPLVTGASRRAASRSPLVVIGASTGGTEALRTLLQALPADAPPVLVVQHMPAKFTKPFADRLNQLCAVDVAEAANDDRLERGQVRIAPGDRHLLVRARGQNYHSELRDGPAVSRHRPSVDVLFRSASVAAGSRCAAALLTGMGDDGARGMAELKDAGAFTIAQDEATSVVFGMPHEAIKRNAVDAVLPLGKIAGRLLRETRKED